MHTHVCTHTRTHTHTHLHTHTHTNTLTEPHTYVLTSKQTHTNRIYLKGPMEELDINLDNEFNWYYLRKPESMKRESSWV